jgi:SAM-dependent methyltransferase
MEHDPDFPTDVTQRHQENRDAWNEAARRYEQEIEEDVAYLRSGGSSLQAPEQQFLQDLSTWCRRAIHLQCAGGRDTMGLLNQGAAHVAGIDISERMIECARRKSAALNAPASWYCCDVLDVPHELNSTADLVYTGKGALLWIMDIEAWARVVARLLKPGGRLYVFDAHPLTWVWDNNATEFRLDPKYGDYFSEAVAVSQDWPSQYMPESALITNPAKKAPSRKHERQWTLGHILSSLAGANLYLERFKEHPEHYWNQFPNIPDHVSRRLPHTFSLLMRKPE